MVAEAWDLVIIDDISNNAPPKASKISKVLKGEDGIAIHIPFNEQRFHVKTAIVMTECIMSKI